MSNLEKFIADILEINGRNYDSAVNLLGGFDPDCYTPEYRKQHFRDAGRYHSYPESLAYALGLLSAGKEEARALAILQTFCAHGVGENNELYWFSEEKHIRDRNANFFNGIVLLHMFLHFRDRLPDGLAGILRNLYPVFAGERALTDWSYANPSLARYMFCPLLAEIFDLPELEHDEKEFMAYADFMLEQGVNENLTPAYFAIDMMILFTGLAFSGNPAAREKIRRLLDEIFIRQTGFFGTRFPAPFRRGYNGYYRGRRTDFMPFLMNWSDTCETGRDNYLNLLFPVIYKLTMKDQIIHRDSDFPRTLAVRIYRECTAVSYLDRDFSLGSFNFYPPETTVWQTVNTGGSGWQDGPVYLTFEVPEETTMILRLEAEDAAGNTQFHPYQGDFAMNKASKLFPFRSFPPEPQLMCRQQDGALLCLYKTDRIDAELQRYGFNLHFSRFHGSVEPYGKGVIIKIGPVFVYLEPLSRVDMGRSNLLRGEFIEPEFTVIRNRDELDLRMDHYCGPAQSFVQNNVSGGFFLQLKSGCTRNEFLDCINQIKISDCWFSDRCNAHIDKRDSIRQVTVATPARTLELTWNHYLPSSVSQWRF